MDALCQETLRPLATGFWDATQNDSDLIVVPLDDQLLQRAATLFAQRPDKNWSMTDCISFDVMRERGIATALTGDRRFEQAGFQALLKNGTST